MIDSGRSAPEPGGERDRWVTRLIHLAATAVRVPTAVVFGVGAGSPTVLDGHGLPTDLERGREVPWERSLCCHVMRTGVPLVSGNATVDPRFADSPAVRRFGVAAYAGFPLRDRGGDLVGVFCVIDHRPREWSVTELAVLAESAELIADALGADPATGGSAVGSGDEPGNGFLDGLLDSLYTGVAACDDQGRLVLLNRALRSTM